MAYINSNLSFEERERIAYITGDVQTAATFDEAEEAAAEIGAGHEDALNELADFIAERKGALPKKALAAAIRSYLEDPADVSLSALLDRI